MTVIISKELELELRVVKLEKRILIMAKCFIAVVLFLGLLHYESHSERSYIREMIVDLEEETDSRRRLNLNLILNNGTDTSRLYEHLGLERGEQQ